MKKPLGKILIPSLDSNIGSNVKIEGFVRNIPEGNDLWIAHRRVKGGKIWPKEPMVIPDVNGSFSLNTFEGGAPGKITISLLMIERSISSEFNHWFEIGHKTDDYPGIYIEGKKILELTNIEVTYNKDRPLRLFYSYSHGDEKLRDKLEKHLSVLKREKYVETWSDRFLTGGTDFSEKIHDEIEKADIILLLVSSNFLASDYCYNVEMKRALERHKSGEARMIPIIIRPSDWARSPFGHLLALPKDGKAVATWQNQDEAWLNITHGIRRVIKELR